MKGLKPEFIIHIVAIDNRKRNTGKTSRVCSVFKLASLCGNALKKFSIFLLNPIKENKTPSSINVQLLGEIKRLQSIVENENIFFRNKKEVFKSIEKNTQPIRTMKKVYDSCKTAGNFFSKRLKNKRSKTRNKP